jgi:hypothetical protein
MSDLDEFVNNIDNIEIINDNKDELIKATEWDYGTSAYKITNKEIEALKNGKILVLNVNDEYSALIKYYGDDKDEH